MLFLSMCPFHIVTLVFVVSVYKAGSSRDIRCIAPGAVPNMCNTFVLPTKVPSKLYINKNTGSVMGGPIFYIAEQPALPFLRLASVPLVAPLSSLVAVLIPLFPEETPSSNICTAVFCTA